MINRCGWGSCALYFAEMLPKSKVTAFSNSKTQKEYIDSKAKEKGFTNLTVITGNVVDYEFEKESFDRVVSIEVSVPLTLNGRVPIDFGIGLTDWHSCLST